MLDNILLILFVLLLTAKLVGSLFEKIGLDSTIGELLTGIAFGPSIFNLISAASIEQFAITGSIFILFVAGMREENIKEIYSDKIAVKMGAALLLITTVVMSCLFYFLPPLFSIHFSLFQAIFLGLAFSVIDLGVPAKVLISKGLIKLPVGRITIRSAIVNLVLGLSLFTILSMLTSINVYAILTKLLYILLFMGLIVALLYFMSKISKFVIRLHIDEAEFSLAIILVLFLAYITDVIGFSSVLGAFIAGQLIGRLNFAGTRSFSDKIKSISFGLFIPLFFVWFGLSINVKDIISHFGLAIIIFLVYSIIRFGTAYFFVKKNHLDMPALVSSTMLSVDVESLVILIVAIRIGIFKDNLPLLLFAPSVLLSTLLVVFLVAVFWHNRPQIQLAKKKARNAA